MKDKKIEMLENRIHFMTKQINEKDTLIKDLRKKETTLLKRINDKDNFIEQLLDEKHTLKREVINEKREEELEARRIEKNKTGDERGDEGEDFTAANMRRLKDLDGYSLNNIRFYLDNNTYEIDHIFVCNRGVFLIETKNWGANISGDIDADNWEYQNSNFKKKVRSPLVQNIKNIKRLKRAANIDKNIDVQSVVVFAGNTTFSFKTIKEYMIKPDQLREYITNKEVIYDDATTRSLFKKINDCNQPITHAEHLASVEKRKKAYREEMEND
jgi:hypothetical protein